MTVMPPHSHCVRGSGPGARTAQDPVGLTAQRTGVRAGALGVMNLTSEFLLGPRQWRSDSQSTLFIHTENQPG